MCSIDTDELETCLLIVVEEWKASSMKMINLRDKNNIDKINTVRKRFAPTGPIIHVAWTSHMGAHGISDGISNGISHVINMILREIQWDPWDIYLAYQVCTTGYRAVGITLGSPFWKHYSCPPVRFRWPVRQKTSHRFFPAISRCNKGNVPQKARHIGNSSHQCLPP